MSELFEEKEAAEYTLKEDRKYIREEPPKRAALSCIYAHRRERYYITMLYPAFGDMIYISIVHFLALLQTIPQLRWGIV